MKPYKKGDIVSVCNTLGNFWAEVATDVSEKAKLVPVKIDIPEEGIDSILNISRDSIESLPGHITKYLQTYGSVYNVTITDITEAELENLQTQINETKDPKNCIITFLLEKKVIKDYENERD